MPNPEMVAVIAKGLRDGLPHPGDRDNHQTAQLIRMPGMNTQGLPQEVLDHMAKEAGLPSSDIAQLVAEALVNLIETDGASEIITKAELKELRQALDKAYAELRKLRENAHRVDQVDSGENATRPQRHRPVGRQSPHPRGEGV